MSEKIYGRKPVLEALRSGSRAITRVYLMQGSRDGILNQIEAHAQAKGITITLETRHRMDSMAGSDKHQGAIAVADDYRYAELQDLLDIARDKKEPAFILLLDEIEDPHNLGAIIRSADAAGVHGVVIPKNRAVEVNATVIKASAGAAEHVTTVKVTNMNDTIKTLKEANVWVVGTDIDATKNFFDYDYRQPVALVIGNEGKGMRRLVKENCDELVRIPMAGKMSSLNASVASAMLLFEVTRQRRWRIKNYDLSSGVMPPGGGGFSSGGLGASSIPPSFQSAGAPPGFGFSPPERDFFRSGPDPALEAPDQGLAQGFGLNSDEKVEEGPQDPLGNNKGGGFHW